MDNSRGSRKALLLVFLVFAMGISLGAVGTYVVTTRVQAAHPAQPVHNPANTIAIFTRNLNLDAEQQKQIMTILSETRARYAEIHKQADPEYEQARQQGRDKIRHVLTAEQGPKFEEMLAKMDEERRRRQNEGR